MKNYESLSHTRYDSKYHVVFIPKYRRKKIYGAIRRPLGEIFHELAKQKESRILEGHLMWATGNMRRRFRGTVFSQILWKTARKALEILWKA